MPHKENDILLDELERTNLISVRAINICRVNRLTGLNDIIFFFQKNGSYKRLKNCGDKTNNELLEIYKKLRNGSLDLIIKKIKKGDEVKNLINEFTNEDIEATNQHIEYLILKLTVRARNGLYSLFQGAPKALELVEKIYSYTFSFRNIRNIGDKTIAELENFKDDLSIFIERFHFQEERVDVIENLQSTENAYLSEDFTAIINEFNPFKKAALNRHIEYLISNLTIRAKNGITQFFGKTFTAKKIIETIYSYSFDFQSIKNIGSKTVSELNDFKADISSFINTLKPIEDNRLSREYAKLIVQTTFSNLPVNFNEQFDSVFDKTGKIKLFKLIHFLIETGHIIKQKQKELFEFRYAETYTKSLEQIAIKLNLGKERLRQIKVTLKKEIQVCFRFILSFSPQDLVSYDISKETYFKIIDWDFAQKINTAEEVKFNPLFYSIIFGLFFRNSHSTLGSDENVSGVGNYSNTIRYKNCYIIDNTFFHSFDFATFINDVSLHLGNRITETYSLYFEGYLLQFVKEEGKQYLFRIKEICETIIYNELDLVISIDGYIVFERNTKRPLIDYVVELLKEIGDMTKIEDITTAINEKYPALNIKEQSVRSTLHRERNQFIYIGRTSTYGLRKWQNERVNLKGGTIRDIVEEFLTNSDEPRHITEIMEHVLKYRNTNEYSVKSNLKLEDNKRFEFFPGDFLGMQGKKYKNVDKYKRVSGSHFRISIFENMNGWDLEDVINYFVANFNYQPIQVRALIEKKILSRELSLTSNNKLKI